MTLGTATVLHEKRPPWAFAGADLDLDFANGRGWVAPGRKSLRDLLSVTRASVGYAEYQSGVWLPSASGVARITDKGLLVEEARTNEIRNNSMQGASAPSTLPTNWSGNGVAELTPTVVGTGTENGVDYIDVRVSGTTTTARSFILYFETATGITAAEAEVWVVSSFLSIVGGDETNVTTIALTMNQIGGSPAFQSSSPLTLTSALTRFDAGAKTLAASVTNLRPGLNVLSGTGAVDITIRIGWPQAEEGSFVTSPIRTTTAAATRAADVITSASVTPGSTGTLFAEFMIPAIPSSGTNFTIFEADNGAALDRVEMTTGTGSLVSSFVVRTTASTTLSGNGVGNWAVGSPSSVSIAYAANDTAFVLDGGTVTTDTSVTVPTMTGFQFGSRAGGTNYLNGYVRRAAYFPTRLTNAQLQALTT